MAVSATLRTTEIQVAPGAAARCHVLVRNTSAVVDQFGFEVRGDAGEWTRIKPERANLMPQQEVGVELTFVPPRAPDVPAGEHPFALVVSSREDPAGSVVQEGTVTVGPFTEHEADIVPVTSSGRRAGRHTLAVDNLGNHPHAVTVSAADPDAKLTFRVRPAHPVLEPGDAHFVRVVARPEKYFWRGKNRRLPFVVRLHPPDAEPIELQAVFEQSPLIPRRLFWLFPLLFALLLILVLIATTLLRQRPVSVAGPSPTVASAASATSAPPSTTTSSSAPPSSSSSATPPPSSTAGPGDQAAGAVTTTSATFTIGTEAYPNVGGGPQLFSYVVPPGPAYAITSVVLRDPAADTGQVEIRHEDAVVGTFTLAQVGQDSHGRLTFRPKAPPVIPAGERVTLAVTCTNTQDPCTPSGIFTATPVP
ncbi:hypothetical protein [Amycolatopsis sp. PS_44_ISF1]|uniref:COG1470 family protein n=1 Tax=Amycolatopsis sp. PS_44_ISF1 TaxID=2974917 RepID=UPI0028DE720B|nr:hypothetical protein [Amycolatopsis sp. PS_44_ISF1]MDT8913120.1 hypothetical protein [Amycolatopsis sp. PS_44_ISF1]